MITIRAEETGVGRTGTTRRRALLATGAAAAAVLTGCSSDTPAGPRTAGTTADPAEAARALRRRLAARSTALLGEYDAVTARHPALTARLAPLRAAVAEHAAALSGSPATAPVPPRPSATATAPAAVAGGSVAEDPAAALRGLAAAERRTSAEHTASLMDAEPELARLLASVAAAGSAHAYLLTKGDAR
ncbi:hypothetical protein [Streptomyces sp. t39]|uniref:hypothetical protein n=1 Tax=Streptomyces sp. t39 TaxID=1828156 RepID=UPI0021C925BC|nr:hypothetical protein [Streptomyces sp. t39]